MARLLIGALVVAVAATVYSLVDCALSDRRGTRGLPKAAWLAAIVLLPVVGALLWFLVGRPRPERRTPPRGPDDDPAFLRAPTPAPATDEETLRRLEQELAGLDADSDDDGEPRRR